MTEIPIPHAPRTLLLYMLRLRPLPQIMIASHSSATHPKGDGKRT